MNAATRRAIVMACAAFAAIGVAWGKAFSLDLRKDVRNVAAKTRLMASARIQSEDADALRSFDLDAGVADVGAVEVGDELTFTLFDDVTITLSLREKMPSPLGGDVFIAETSGYDGVKNAVVLRTDCGLVVDVHDSRRKRVYKVISTADGVKVREIEAKGRGKCGSDARIPQVSSGKATAKKLAVRKCAKTAEAYVDILVAYDKGAASWANSNGGGLTNFAQTAVQKMNYALANVGLDSSFRFRLVGVVAVPARTRSLDFALDAATDGWKGWECVMEKRDEVGADIVTVLVDTGSAYGVTGLGWSLWETDFAAFAESAYNACSIRSVAQSHTMTHEVGHNMGCGHSDEQWSDPGPQLYNFSAGYYFQAGDDYYHTIMAYDDEGLGGDEVPYFSSPKHKYLGVAVGDKTHDNAQTLVRTFAAAAQWRIGGAGEIGGDVSEPLTWITSRADALRKAKAEGKYILLISGRETCINTLLTRDYTCETPNVRAALEEYVPWFCDCDKQEDSDMYAKGLRSFTLPLVCVINPLDSANYIERSCGYLDEDAMLALLKKAGPPPGMKTVTFNANGGEVEEQERKVAYGNAVGDLPTPSNGPIGHSFAGWFTKTNGGSQVKATTKIKKDITCYAKWAANKYKIKFYANGGSGSMDTLVATYGKKVTLTANAFKRTNYTFIGWATSADGDVVYADMAKVKNLAIKDGKIVKLYAVWMRETYTVKFSANGGEGGTVKQTVNCGEKTALDKNAFTREGYEFAGWATKKNGTVVYKNKAKITDLAKGGKSIMLYAVWKPAKWAVGTFEGDAEIGGKAATVTMTVSSAGKISGKFVRTQDKKSYSFKADNFDGFADGALRATATMKYGSKSCTLMIAIVEDAETGEGLPAIDVMYNEAEYGWGFVEIGR